jgi:hypothetical protein
VFKWIKRSLIALSLIAVTMTSVYAVSNYAESDNDISLDNYQFIEDMKLNSTRYSRVDDLSLVDPTFYVTIDGDDEEIADNANFTLYYDEEFVSFKVLNKDTGYVWATNIEDPNAGTFTPLLESGIGIEYINVQKSMTISENIGITDTVYIIEREDIDNGIRLNLNFGGYCQTRTCERFYPRYLEGEYTKEEMIEFGLTEINVGFTLEVTLDDTGIRAHVPFESIVENNPEEVVLSSIIIFPALGATHMDDIPGYMVLPEGSGALIRYEDNEGKYNAPLIERFYGDNVGLSSNRASILRYPLSMPIFGAVHGVNQNAMLGIIEEGDVNARLVAFPNGALNVDYNLIFTKIDYRQAYRQAFTSDGSAGAMRQLQTYTGDTTIAYQFLSDDDSTYVGIGSAYRNYLIERGVLTQQTAETDVPLNIEYFMSDSEATFFGSTIVETSTVEDVMNMYDELYAAGITNQRVILSGWNDGGYSGYLPSDLDFENSLGSNRSFRDLIAHINEDNSVLLRNGYLIASDVTKGISYRRDVAKATDRFKLEWQCDDCVVGERYVLYPDVSKELAFDHYEDYLDENVGVMMEDLGSFLFSYYDGGYFIREDALNHYLEVFEQYQGTAAYQYPFAYAYAYTDSFYEVPLYNSQMKYYDDLIPLVQIVLHGTMDLFGPHLNFNSLGKEQILGMIDFGVNPSYILTQEPSSSLKDTDMSQLFTTEFGLWKSSVVETYTYVNDALRHVDGEFITARTVLDTGIVKVEYSNNVTIYVNYTSSDYAVEGIIIPALDYHVGGVS